MEKLSSGVLEEDAGQGGNHAGSVVGCSVKVIVLWNEAEGVPLNTDGEGHREQAEAKSFRREREVPGEEGEEVKSPKRKVNRV